MGGLTSFRRPRSKVSEFLPSVEHSESLGIVLTWPESGAEAARMRTVGPPKSTAGAKRIRDQFASRSHDFVHSACRRKQQTYQRAGGSQKRIP